MAFPQQKVGSGVVTPPQAALQVLLWITNTIYT